MAGYMEFSFGQGDAGIGDRAKRFKGEAGRTYRAGFIWLPSLATGKLDFGSNEAPVTPVFAGAQVNYIEGVGYIINKGAEYTQLAGGEAPRARIGTVIVLWPTDKAGKLDKAALARGEAEVIRWIFSKDKYQGLQQVDSQFPLARHDLLMVCTDSQYQKMTFTPCRESLLMTLSENKDAAAQALVEKLITEATSVVADIQSDIGREMTPAQIREKMAGVEVSANPGAAAATTNDIDSMVGGLLDD